MRKRLQLAWMLTRTTAIATSLALILSICTSPRASAAEGDGPSRGITTSQEHGRTVYVNEDGPSKPREAVPAPQPKRTTLVYWSSKENRWKPVPSANTASMQ